MNIIDTHCHYNLSPLFEEWSKLWSRAQTNGVVGAVVVGTNVATSQVAIDLAVKENGFFSAVGIHPTEARLINASVQDSLQQMREQVGQIQNLARSDQVIAIGECGLDYFRQPENDDSSKIVELQKELLIDQLQIANQLNLPLSVHLRDKGEQAYWDFLDLYQKHSQQPFVLHCISGPKEFVDQAVKMGAYIGIDGNITYPNTDELRNLVKIVPRERILLETDAPYLPPVPHRGKTCLPEMIELTAEYLRGQLNINPTQIMENTLQFFPKMQRLVK